MSTPPLVAAIETLADLEAERRGWAALAAAAIAPNPFYEPDFLIASGLFLEPRGRIRFLTLRDAANGFALVGLLPLIRPKLRTGIGFGAISLYTSPYTSLSTPLLARHCAEAALGKAFDFLASTPGFPDIVLLPQINLGSGFAAAFDALVQQRGLPVRIVAHYQRAAIETGLSAEAYERSIGAATRRNLRRKENRLAEAGRIAFDSVPGDAPGGPAALAEFLALEAAGWKGARRTAMASRAETLAFASLALRSTGAGPRAVFERLSIDGRAIAMNLNLVSGATAFTMKTAYDERFAQFSPGALLDRHSIALAARGGPFRQIDSCAQPGHRLDLLWRERVTIARVLVGLSPAVSGAQLDRIAARMRLADQAIATAKDFTSRVRRHPQGA